MANLPRGTGELTPCMGQVRHILFLFSIAYNKNMTPEKTVLSVYICWQPFEFTEYFLNWAFSTISSLENVF